MSSHPDLGVCFPIGLRPQTAQAVRGASLWSCLFLCFFLLLPSNRIGELPSLLQEFAPRVLVMYFIAAVAFLFYISKVPERYFPGRTLSTGWFLCS